MGSTPTLGTMGIFPREVPRIEPVPELPKEQRRRPAPRARLPETEGVLSPVSKERFKEYFHVHPELGRCEIYEVPMEEVVIDDNGVRFATKEVIRDPISGAIAGLPRLDKRKGEKWKRFYGPDPEKKKSIEYVMRVDEKTKPLFDEEMEAWTSEPAPIE